MNDKVAPKFASFFWAGFECTYATVNKEKQLKLDLLAGSKHDKYCREDYQLIKELGIRTVREGLSWSEIDQGKIYDFSRFEKMIQIGSEESVEQVWDLNHFDFPKDVDPFSEVFIHRFEEYAKRAIQVIRKYYQSGILYIVPINEISFFTFVGADRGWWAPYAVNRGDAFKRQLIKASIAAMKTLEKEDHNLRFIQVDPIMYRRAKDPKNKKTAEMAKHFNEVARFESWDILSGTKWPELGGEPKYLDIIGVNYYAVNQEWIVENTEGDVYQILVPPEGHDHVSFSQLLKDIQSRYHRPMVISETGSHGEWRPSWWEKILKEIDQAMDKHHLPIYSVCAYPTVDKPTEIPFLWPMSGLWDSYQLDPEMPREPHRPTLDVIKPFIRKWQNSPLDREYR